MLSTVLLSWMPDRVEHKMEASQVKVHDIPNLTCFSRGHVASLQQQRCLLSASGVSARRAVMGSSPRWLVSLEWRNPSVSPRREPCQLCPKSAKPLAAAKASGCRGKKYCCGRRKPAL